MIFPTPQTQQHLMPSILYRERYQANNIRASAWELTSGKVWPGPAQFSRQLEYSKKEAAGRLAQSGGAWRERERERERAGITAAFSILSFFRMHTGRWNHSSSSPFFCSTFSLLPPSLPSRLLHSFLPFPPTSISFPGPLRQRKGALLAASFLPFPPPFPCFFPPPQLGE